MHEKHITENLMKKLILCLAVMMLGIVGAIAQTKDGGISEDMLGRIRQGYQGTPEQKAVKNALASNSIAALAIKKRKPHIPIVEAETRSQ